LSKILGDPQSYYTPELRRFTEEKIRKFIVRC